MLKQNKGERLIFVSGAPRSGTTLVQNMLDSHPDICGGPEFLHIPDIILLRNKLHASIEKKWIDLYCSHEQVDALTSLLIESFLLPLADKHGCVLLSEKSPSSILVFPDLIKMFPAARFINVVRDPRAIVASMLQVGVRAKRKNIRSQKFTRSLTHAIDHVESCFDSGFEASLNAGERLLTVVYEGLVKDPEYETKRICNFLNINWSSQMICPSKKKHLGENAITINSNEIWYDANTYNSDPTTKNIHKWKATLTPAQQIAISLSFKDSKELVQLGYDFSLDGWSATRRIVYTSLYRFFRTARELLHHIPSFSRKLARKPSSGLRLLAAKKPNRTK